MKRYLVFNAKCSACSKLARSIEDAVGDKLEAINIDDSKAMTLLNQAYPEGWEHAPYLVTVEHGKVRAWTGINAVCRLTILMGPRQTWRIWSLARQHGVLWPFDSSKPSAFTEERRQFLKTGIGVVLATGVAKLFNYSIFEPEEVHAAPCDCTPPCSCTHVDTQTSCICYCHNCNVCPARSDYEVRNICLCGAPCNGYWHCVTVYCNSWQCSEQCA